MAATEGKHCRMAAARVESDEEIVILSAKDLDDADTMAKRA
jgi:hypothetical protein